MYNREFERLSGAYCFTNTHGMRVVVRICVEYLCGLHSGIPLSLKDFGGSWEHTSQAEYVWGTCVDLIPADSGISLSVKDFGGSWEEKAVKYRVRVCKREFERLSGAQTHMWLWWLWDRICVRCLHGLASGIPEASREFGGSWEDKSWQMPSPCVWRWIWAIFGCLFLHECTCDCSDYQIEYVWDTCMDCNPGYHKHRTSIEAVWRKFRA
jgi:hypothetical protein